MRLWPFLCFGLVLQRATAFACFRKPRDVWLRIVSKTDKTEEPTNSATSFSSLKEATDIVSEAYSGGVNFYESSLKRPQIWSCIEDAASENTLLNANVVKKKAAVLSPHVERTLAAYTYSEGGVIVMCSPPDTGKTHAAHYLIHGDHPIRPSRALMMSARGMDNFPLDFMKSVFGFRDSRGFCTLLCMAVTDRYSKKEESAILKSSVGSMVKDAM